MNKKIIICLIFTLTLLTFGGLALFNPSSVAEAQENKLWNLQKLEELAETGNVEAQLRLIDFYRPNINRRDHYKERLNFWLQKSEVKKQTDEYSLAVSKLQQERTEKWKQREAKEEAMNARLKAMKEKYEKLGSDAKKDEAMMWHDGLNAVFNMEEVYSWEVPYKWRYRITINIDTPDGVKSGTTVRELYFPPADKNIYASSNQGIARGDAVYIDLGQRGVVFAILSDTANSVNKFSSLIRTVFPTVPQVYDGEKYHQVLQHYDELKGVKDEVPPYLYPKFVHFEDVNNPQTIELVYQRKSGSRNDMKQVDVDRLEEVFGKGVSIQNITIEMTDDPLEWKLANKLGWIETMDAKDIKRSLRQADPPIRMTNGIGHYVFRQAQQDPWEKIKAEKRAKQEMTEKLSKYKAYDNYDDIPKSFGRNLYQAMTLDKYISRISKDENPITKNVLDEAMRAFVTVDLNKDGKISYHESNKRRKKN